jgi:hypothetical protein
MNTICKKTLVIGIILLLAGVSVSSAISVDNKPVLSQDESEDCSECKKSESRICDLLHIWYQTIELRLEMFSELWSSLGDYPLIQELLILYYYVFMDIRFTIPVVIAYVLECDWLWDT